MPTCVSSLFWTLEKLENIEPLITWSLVIAGWFFVKRDQNKRAQRVESRGLLTDIVKLIDETEKKAYEYYSKDGDDQVASQLAREIRRSLQRLPIQIKIFNHHSNKDLNMDDKIMIFRQAVTLNGFDSLERKKSKSGDTIWLGISNAALSLTMELEIHFQEIYRY